MLAFALSMLGLCTIAASLQFWSARCWFRSPAYSIAFAAVVASLCLQVVTAGLTLTGFVDPESSFMSYFHQDGQLTVQGVIASLSGPTLVGIALALVPAGLVGTLLRPEV